MAHHNITVKLNAQQKVVVTPNGQKCDRGHTIGWICTDGGLRIEFKDKDSPFTSGNDPVLCSSGTTAREKVKLQGHKRKHYKYRVIVITPQGEVPSKDPDLIVEDWGGGDKKKKAAKKKAAKPKTKK